MFWTSHKNEPIPNLGLLAIKAGGIRGTNNQRPNILWLVDTSLADYHLIVGPPSKKTTY